MSIIRRAARLLVALPFAASLHAQSKPTVAEFLSPASPLELTSARKADRVAWMAYEKGMRNVYTAAAPDFKAVRLTKYLADDGIDLTSVELSDDNAENTNARGNSEYQDVLAGAKYLQGRADVDAARLGIWGLSYGGLLTSEALARNSDIFIAGADLAGVHQYGPVLDTNNIAFKSSAIGAIDGWKSPVYLVHGGDDRNVDFGQTVGLVQLLRARNIYYELKVIPDDQHESMIHQNWVDTFNEMGTFFRRFVWDREKAP